MPGQQFQTEALTITNSKEQDKGKNAQLTLYNMLKKRLKQ